MAKKVKTQSQVKKKKKSWVQINSPKIFGQKKIGETHVYAPGDAQGKTVEHNLMNLTGDMKKQNITIKFEINKVTGTVAQTRIISYKMAPAFIKRLVRRRRDRIDLSKVYTTKDNVKVRIKPLIITTTKARGSTLTMLRRTADTLIAKKIKQTSFNALVEEIITFKFQGYLKNNLKKIHPLRNCDVRVFEIERGKGRKDDVEISDETEEESSEETEEKKETENKDDKKEEAEKTEESKDEKEETESEDKEEETEEKEDKKEEAEESNDKEEETEDKDDEEKEDKKDKKE